MSRKWILTGVALFVGLLVLSLSLFTVHQREQVLVLQLGDPRRVIQEPGLHVKVPFIQNVVRIDQRVLELDVPAEEVIASDQKRLVVDAFVRYRITDPLKFYITLQSAGRAYSRLSALLSSNMRSVLGKAPFVSVVRDDRAALMQKIRVLVNGQASDFGIEVVDVRIRRADLPEANSRAVYRRMQTERQQEAAQIRAVGQEASREIHAEADKQVTVELANAERDAQVIRGQGDACRNRVFAGAYGRDPNFFSFYRTMQSYERSLGGENTSLVLSPTGPFFRFFNNPAATASAAAPPRSAPSAAPTSGDLRKFYCPELPVNQ